MSVKKCLEQIESCLNERVTENVMGAGAVTKECLERIGMALYDLVRDSNKSREDREVDEARETGAAYREVRALRKRALQVKVMDAEEELCDAREALDEHLAHTKKLRSMCL